MKCFIQFALRQPRDYQLRDSSEWASLPTKPWLDLAAPYDTFQLDNNPGWVNDLGVQGISFGGADHYSVADLTDGSGGITVTRWSDAPLWNPMGARVAQVWTILPLAPDSRFGGALNTRQSQVVYAERPDAWARWSALMPLENTTLAEWSAFVPPAPALVRHGIWLTDALYAAHLAALTPHGWREWSS